jgi:hypothetical protein
LVRAALPSADARRLPRWHLDTFPGRCAAGPKQDRRSGGNQHTREDEKTCHGCVLPPFGNNP